MVNERPNLRNLACALMNAHLRSFCRQPPDWNCWKGLGGQADGVARGAFGAVEKALADKRGTSRAPAAQERGQRPGAAILDGEGHVDPDGERERGGGQAGEAPDA